MTKDEMEEEFFSSLKIPQAWRFIGIANIKNASVGKVYEAEKGVIYRIFYTTA